MLDRIKRALVESFAGAIAIGWLLSQGIFHCVQLVILPLTVWAQTKFEQAHDPARSILYEEPVRLPYERVGSELLMVLLLLLLAFLLLRWLYMEPAPQPAIEEPEEDIEIAE
jgi:predicted Kef-type K+ transport protein